MRVAYYVYEIPDIASSTRYNHALALAEQGTESILLTHKKPPESIQKSFDHIEILSINNSRSNNILNNLTAQVQYAKSGAKKIDRLLETDDILVTAFHYSCALVGIFTNVTWVVDVYDDPYQYILGSPQSIHQVGARLLKMILLHADKAVHTIHPASPRLIGNEQRFAINGSATSIIEPGEKPPRNSLQCVWAGQPRLDRGMDKFLRALNQLDEPIQVDIFGAPYKGAKALAERLNVIEDVIFHGLQPHAKVINAIETAHIGLALYPPREDWKYSYPIKVGEYLAGGTIPLNSSFPGMRELSRNAGVYTEYSVKSIERQLRKLNSLQETEYQKMQKKARLRAESVSWYEERKWFATQAIDRPHNIV